MLFAPTTRDAVLIARSAESDSHPLFWGTAPSNPEVSGSEHNSNLEALSRCMKTSACPRPCP